VAEAKKEAAPKAAKKKKIRALIAVYSGPLGRQVDPGEVVELEVADAEIWVRDGWGEAVSATKKKAAESASE